jgi:hypothetical protein
MTWREQLMDGFLKSQENSENSSWMGLKSQENSGNS